MATDSERIVSLERRMDVLENIELIKKLKARYVRACDLKKPDEIRDCFIQDASIDFTLARWDNRDDFVDYYTRWGTPATKIDIHHAMNGVVEITGPEANNVALLMLRIATLVMLWLASLAGPVVMTAKFGRVTAPAFSTVVTLFEARFNVGG